MLSKSFVSGWCLMLWFMLQPQFINLLPSNPVSKTTRRLITNSNHLRCCYRHLIGVYRDAGFWKGGESFLLTIQGNYVKFVTKVVYIYQIKLRKSKKDKTLLSKKGGLVTQVNPPGSIPAVKYCKIKQIKC